MASVEGLDAIALERVVADAALQASDTVMIDTPTWLQRTTLSVAEGTANGVYLARMSEAEADERIAAVVRSHVERDAEFRWFVGPSSTPSDLPERLLRAGLIEFGAALGMWRVVPDEVPPLPAGVELHELGLHNLEAFTQLTVRAWGREPAFARVVETTQRRAFVAGPTVIRSWLVTRDGEGVGTTTLRLLPGGIGYLQGAAVVPEQRRAGIYRAMVHHRLALLRELGYAHAVIWANEKTSALGCARMGFEARCRGEFFEWRRKP